jgi:hypothetical protein
VRPSPGNHEYYASLNIECESAAFNNDCSTTDGGLLSQETQWLSADLAGNHKWRVSPPTPGGSCYTTRMRR